MSSLAHLYVLLVAAVTVPFVAVRFWRRQKWAVDALATISRWPISGDGTLAVKLGEAVGSARVVDALGHTSVELRLRFPNPEAAWAALDRVPNAARLLPVVQTERESDRTIVVRFSWETLVVPADVVRGAIAEIACGGPPVGTNREPAVDPVFAAVARKPRLAEGLTRLAFVAVFVGLMVGSGDASALMLMALVGVNQLARGVRTWLGLAAKGRHVPFARRFFLGLAIFMVTLGLLEWRWLELAILVALAGVLGVLELARAGRAARIVRRLRWATGTWLRAAGIVRDPERGSEMRPFVLDASGGEFWVEAGPTHTLVGGPVRDGDRVEVMGRVAELPADSTYRAPSRKLLSGDAETPLTIATPGIDPVRWLSIEATLATLTAAGYVLSIAVPMWLR